MKQLLAKEEHGVALAAVQVGEPVRLFIVSGKALARGSRSAPDAAGAPPGKPDSSSEAFAKEDEPRIEVPRLRQGFGGQTSSKFQVPHPDQIYINPVLLKLSRKKTEKHEGCLSIRGKWGEVPRAEKATLRYVDEHGVVHTRGASDFLAHIFQHEMDHLEGILYTDKAVALYDEPAAKK